MTVTNTSRSHASRRGPVQWSLRLFALLSFINVVLQGVTAGEVLAHNHLAFTLHEAGAIVLHVLTGITAIVAALVWLRTRSGLSTALLAALIFVATFVQAAYGHGRTLYIHVPLALLITAGAVWVLARSWTATADAPTRGLA